jgi:hypothetical protein
VGVSVPTGIAVLEVAEEPLVQRQDTTDVGKEAQLVVQSQHLLLPNGHSERLRTTTIGPNGRR